MFVYKCIGSKSNKINGQKKKYLKKVFVLCYFPLLVADIETNAHIHKNKNKVVKTSLIKKNV